MFCPQDCTYNECSAVDGMYWRSARSEPWAGSRYGWPDEQQQPSSQEPGDPSQQPLVSPPALNGHDLNPGQRRLSSPPTHRPRSGRSSAPGDEHGLRGSSWHEHERHLHYADSLAAATTHFDRLGQVSPSSPPSPPPPADHRERERQLHPDEGRPRHSPDEQSVCPVPQGCYRHGTKLVSFIRIRFGRYTQLPTGAAALCTPGCHHAIGENANAKRIWSSPSCHARQAWGPTYDGVLGRHGAD